MLLKSSIQLLRFPFSFFLLPVSLFALGQVPEIDIRGALLIFFILHFLVYPSSNGYNSYMDRDSTPVGGLANPMQPTRQLYYITLIMDIAAVLLGFLISWLIAAGILLYILASRAYSYRGIRLKKFPYAGFFLVVFFQGAWPFFLVYQASSADPSVHIPVSGMIASSLLIGGFYPLTQIYQHEADKNDGVITISYLLGYRGTFIFTAVIYLAAMAVLFYHFDSVGEQKNFLVLATVMLPVLVYFFVWASRVWKDNSAADFKHSMRMNLIASVCTNAAFIIILSGRYLE